MTGTVERLWGAPPLVRLVVLALLFLAPAMTLVLSNPSDGRARMARMTGAALCGVLAAYTGFCALTGVP